ncbi:MAG: extracellular solute-binding protein [Bauldia sp.]
MAIAALLMAASGAAGADWDEGGGAAWQSVLAQARKEGGLVFTIGTCGVAEPLARAFKADTGIEAGVVTGSTANADARYRLELQTSRLSIDLRLSGAADLDLAKSGYLADLTEKLLLPSVSGASNWTRGGITWVDDTKKFMAINSEYVSTQPLINTDFVAPDAVQSLADLLKPQFKGKIAAFDPAVGGPGQAIAAYIADASSIDLVKALFVGQDVALSRDSRQIVEWAARGTYPIVLGADAGEVQRFRLQGVKSLKSLSLRDAPGSLVGGCTVLSIPKDAPHMAAATVFLNWFLSPRGQKVYVEAFNLPTLRADVENVGVPADIMPQAGLGYLAQYREDWYLGRRVRVQADLRRALDR